MAKILIIDDDADVCETLSTIIDLQGHEAFSARTLKKGISMAIREKVDIVFLDVNLPDGDGMEAIGKIASTPANPEIIILTGVGNIDGAEIAIERGVWDYIGKPATFNEMTLTFIRALEYRDSKMKRPKPVAIKRDRIIGNSQEINKALDQLAQTVTSDANVLITGETGTGKELFAQAVHMNSNRASNNFVVLDCAALPESLVESMLFGHIKGAFTSADKDREGLIKQADGGTLFLDEVGEMPLTIQKAFLRVLESRKFRPIGSKNEISSNFRIVSSTNRDLEAMVKEGHFRQDLLYRLRAFHIKLPALRKRKEDVKDLAIFHINRFAELYNEKPKGFSPDFFKIIESYPWPGNIRELVNTMETTIASARFDPILYAYHLPNRLRLHTIRKSVKNDTLSEQIVDNHLLNPNSLSPFHVAREISMRNIEHDYLQSLMEATQGDIVEACEISGLKKSRIYGLLKKHGISHH